MSRVLVRLLCDLVAMAMAYFALRLYSGGSLFWATFWLVFAMDVVVMKAEINEAMR